MAKRRKRLVIVDTRSTNKTKISLEPLVSHVQCWLHRLLSTVERSWSKKVDRRRGSEHMSVTKPWKKRKGSSRC